MPVCILSSSQVMYVVISLSRSSPANWLDSWEHRPTASQNKLLLLSVITGMGSRNRQAPRLPALPRLPPPVKRILLRLMLHSVHLSLRAGSEDYSVPLSHAWSVSWYYKLDCYIQHGLLRGLLLMDSPYLSPLSQCASRSGFPPFFGLILFVLSLLCLPYRYLKMGIFL